MLTSKKIKSYAKSCGADLVGIGSMDRFEGAPKQFDPRYMMPEAKTIIVLGFRVLRGLLRGIEEGTFFYGYSSMGYAGINFVRMPVVLWEFCNIIEDAGYEALPLPNNFPWNNADMSGRDPAKIGLPRPEISRPVSPDKPAPDVFIHLRIAAFIAGLGEIGYSKMFLTPEFGPRQRLAAVLTDMPLEPDPIYAGPKLCDRCMSCARECPTQAISKTKTIKIKVAGRDVEWAEIDMVKCAAGFQGGVIDVAPDGEESVPALENMKPTPYNPFVKSMRPVYEYGRAIGGSRGCTRACMIHLEQQGKLKNVFKQPFRRRKPWKLD